jgi:hypothetical protein
MIASTVLYHIKANAAMRIDFVMAIHNDSLELRTTSDNSVIHDDAILEIYIFFQDYLATQDGIADACARH